MNDAGEDVSEMNDAGEDAGDKLVYLHAPETIADDPQTLARSGNALLKKLSDLTVLGFDVTAILGLVYNKWVWFEQDLDALLSWADRAAGPFHVRVRDHNPGESLHQPKDDAALDLNRHARAFRYEFRNLANVNTLFRALSSICDTDNSYARAAGIFQSSGWGKSRTVCELWRHGVWVIYLSFASGTGYPTASSIKDWFLRHVDKCLRKSFMLGQLECMTFSLAYFVACLTELSLRRQKGLTPQEFAVMLSTGLKGAKKFWEDVQMRVMCLLIKYEELPTMAARYENPSDAWAMWADAASLLFREAITGFKQDQPRLSVLFVYDEARHLFNNDAGNPHLNSFIPVRRSAQAMLEHGFSMLLFMDTSSQVSNFADRVWADPSDRVAKRVLNLPPPIWASFSADASQMDWQLFFPSTRVFQDIIRPEWYVRYGRPLWWAQFRSNMEGQTVQSKLAGTRTIQPKQGDTRMALRNVQRLARDKLLGGGGAWDKYFGHGNKNTKLSTEAALSLLGVRVALDVDPECRLASSMVANNLLSVVSVSPSREHLWTTWNVEPLVAQVAADVIKTLHKDGRSEELYDKLVQALTAGWIDKGYAGELVARIILLHAVDKAMGARMYCSVDDFCKSLVKQKESLSSLKLPDSLSAARLHFNAFRRIYKNSDELTFNDFREAFERGYGIICVKGAWGVDLYIVAFCGKDDEELTEQNMTLLHVKVKLREEERSKICYAKISPQFAGLRVMKGLPYLSLYMNVMHKEDASCKVISGQEIEKAVRSSRIKPITYALQQLETQTSALDTHVSKKPKRRNNDKTVDAWVDWLTAERDLQTVLAIKGLSAFDIDEDLKKWLKTTVESSKQIFMEGEPLCKELMKLQREHLPSMFPHMNIENCIQW